MNPIRRHTPRPSRSGPFRPFTQASPDDRPVPLFPRPQPIPEAPNPSTPTRPLHATALAVALGNQRLGLAVVTRERLLSFATVDVWKAGGHDERLELLRRGILRRLMTFEVTEIVTVAPALAESAFTRAATDLLERFAAARGLPEPRRYTRRELKESEVAGARSFHLMALRLANRFPELGHRVRERVERPGYRGIPTAHDEYNRWMFLAVAAGEQALADALTHELPTHAPPDS